ncbi:MAG: hypothetical protein JSW73_00665 [Candidatus Woesearchaeota archaeon]|nr:MAG: hypothetical protein JSW73_00665 [Candidatus Woesearchaeota archaeon]
MIEACLFKNFPEIEQEYNKNSNDWYVYILAENISKKSGNKVVYAPTNKTSNSTIVSCVLRSKNYSWAIKSRLDVPSEFVYDKFKIKDDICSQDTQEFKIKYRSKENVIKDNIENLTDEALTDYLFNMFKNPNIGNEKLEKNVIIFEGPIYASTKKSSLVISKPPGKIAFSLCVAGGKIGLVFDSPEEEKRYFNMNNILNNRINDGWRNMYG